MDLTFHSVPNRFVDADLPGHRISAAADSQPIRTTDPSPIRCRSEWVVRCWGSSPWALRRNFPGLLAGAALLGIGSSIFHLGVRLGLARPASGGAYGFAQSLFQVGGHVVGSGLGPLLAAFVVLRGGAQGFSAVLALAALAGIFILVAVGRWYQSAAHSRAAKP